MQEIIYKSLDPIIRESKKLPSNYLFTELAIVDCIEIILNKNHNNNSIQISF